MAESDCAAVMKSQELHSDPKALGLLVLEALKAHGWENVDPGSIVVEEHSGGSGNMTFRVRATGIDGVEVKPSEVALHSKNAWHMESDAARAAPAASRESGTEPASSPTTPTPTASVEARAHRTGSSCSRHRRRVATPSRRKAVATTHCFEFSMPAKARASPATTITTGHLLWVCALGSM